MGQIAELSKNGQSDKLRIGDMAKAEKSDVSPLYNNMLKAQSFKGLKDGKVMQVEKVEWRQDTTFNSFPK